MKKQLFHCNSRKVKLPYSVMISNKVQDTQTVTCILKSQHKDKQQVSNTKYATVRIITKLWKLINTNVNPERKYIECIRA